MSEEMSNEIESTTNAQKKNKGGRPRSNVWDHFTTFQDKEGRKAKCNYCGKVYFSEPKKHGTSTLRNHTNACTKHPCSEDLKQSRLSLQRIHEEGGMGSLSNWRFDADLCRKKLVEMIIKDELPFKFVRLSPARMVKFKECCEEENIDSKKMLCLDVPTRWNSTYLMLDVACKFEKAFEAFEFKDPYFKIDLEKGPPTEVDWINARKMVEVLARFYRLTLRISGSLYVTSNEFFHEITTMCCLLKNWMKSSDGDISSMATQMKIKFDKYWGDPKKMNKLLFVAVIVDPRYKFEFLEFACCEAYGAIDGAVLAKDSWDAFNELYDAYKLIHQPESDATMQDDHLIHSEPSLDDMDHHHLGDKFKKRKMLSGESSKNDLQIYLQESVLVAGKDFNILNWWKINQHRFPVLCHIARDVLAMPISTVASESAFSAGGRVLDAFRSSLTPKIVETLVCTQDWLRRSKDSITIEEDLDGLLMHEEDPEVVWKPGDMSLSRLNILYTQAKEMSENESIISGQLAGQLGALMPSGTQGRQWRRIGGSQNHSRKNWEG